MWTSLEVVKLITSFFTPLLILFIGIWINKRLKKIEHAQWSNQKVINKRLEVYDELVPFLNDILCYFTFIGCWKELTPIQLIELKRLVDKTAYVNAPLFDENFLKKYNNFIVRCYSTYSGWGSDPKLRTTIQRRKEANSNWEDNWEVYFVEESEISEPKRIKESYLEFVQFFAQEIGIGLFADSVKSGRIPYNIN